MLVSEKQYEEIKTGLKSAKESVTALEVHIDGLQKIVDGKKELLSKAKVDLDRLSRAIKALGE